MKVELPTQVTDNQISDIIKIDMEPQIEDGSDNAYLSENNLVNDSSCEIISEDVLISAASPPL